jgi:imidazolonepropionase-like amidohydrolase
MIGNRQLMTLACLLAASIAFPAPASDERVWVKAGRLLDPVSGQVTRDAVIEIEGDRIVGVGNDTAAIPDGAEVIDLSRHFVLPGLIDMHTHIPGHLDRYYFAGYFASPHRAVIGGVVHAERTLKAGFTTVRNVGAADFQDVALRDAINAGEVPGPRMAVSGPGLGITGGHCDRNALNHAFAERADGVADGPWAVRAKVRENVKYGVDLIKFCATGGVFSKGTIPGQTQYTLEEMQAIVTKPNARPQGRRACARYRGHQAGHPRRGGFGRPCELPG